MINKKRKYVTSFDYETTGLSAYHGAKIFSYCIGWPVLNKKCKLIDIKVEVRRLDNTSSSVNAENFKYLIDYWKNTNIIKVIHNAKFELHFTKSSGIKIPENTIIHDTMIMSQVLRNLSPSHKLDYLGWELFSYDGSIDKKVKEIFKVTKSYQTIPEYIMNPYQVADGQRAILLYYLFIDKLRNNEDYLNEIEVLKATQIEEQRGIKLHIKNAKRIKLELEEKLEELVFNTYKLVGEYINLNSSQQVSRLLYKKLGFNVIRFTKDSYPPTPATDKDALFELSRHYKHNIFDLIFKQRTYTKALATINSYINLADNNLRIHPSFRLNMRNSRKSCKKPNLQNINTEKSFKNPFTVALRKCFRPEKGYVFIPVDYSGIEMRLIVDATKEPELYNLLMKNPDVDVHHPTVECFLMDDIYQIKNDKIYKSGIAKAEKLLTNDKNRYKVIRKNFKNTGFAVAYGGGIERVAEMNMKTIEEILIGNANYRHRFQRIDNFTNTLAQQVHEYGYITTKFNRKLYVPRNKPYIGSNYFISGTAAGILKRAQVRLQKLLSNVRRYKDIHIVLDVHDEIVFEYPRYLLKYKDEILPEFYHIMIDMPEIDIPLRCEFSICTNNYNDKKNLAVVL